MPRSATIKGGSGRYKPRCLRTTGMTYLEQRAFDLMKERKTNEEIMAELCISASRLKQLKGQIRRKLGLEPGTDSRQIVQRAISLGYIE